MKEEAIKKINKFGKIGGILVKIAKVFSIIGAVGVLIGIIAVAVLPDNLVKFSFSGTGSMNVDVSTIGVSLSEEDIAKINEEGIMGNAKIDAKFGTIELDQVNAEGNMITFSSSGEVKDTFGLHDILIILVMAFITVIFTIVSLTFAGKVCNAFKECQSPFEDSVISALKKFAYSLIPWVLLSSVSEAMVSSAMAGNFDFSFSIDISMVIVVLIILALVTIFKYGAILQQESDETL